MSNIDHVHVTCCHKGCSAIITFHRQEHDRLLRTHESWCCPYGHRQRFTGKTDDQKRIEELEERLARLRAERSEDVDLRWEIHERLLEVARGLTICPMGCGWRTPRRLPTREGTGHWSPGEQEIARFFDRVWGDLREHLIGEHNATIAPVALLEPGEVPA